MIHQVLTGGGHLTGVISIRFDPAACLKSFRYLQTVWEGAWNAAKTVISVETEDKTLVFNYKRPRTINALRKPSEYTTDENKQLHNQRNECGKQIKS